MSWGHLFRACKKITWLILRLDLGQVIYLQALRRLHGHYFMVLFHGVA